MKNILCCCSHDFTLCLGVNTTHTNQHENTVAFTQTRARRAGAVVPLLLHCSIDRSRYSRGCASLCNSEEVWLNNVLPPRIHRSLRLPVCIRFDFLGRQEEGRAHAHMQKHGPPPSHKGRASCGTAAVPWLSQGTTL